MKILVCGANGQLGSVLKNTCPSDFIAIYSSKNEIDLTQKDFVIKKIKLLKPDIIINTAAYTSVDKAESERDLAKEINMIGCKNLAIAANNINASLIHISTDYVFDGKKNNPYDETDKTNPLSVYGRTKLWGENEIIENLDKYIIIRTSWLYASKGNNFLNKLVQLSKEREILNIISDQYGRPTFCDDLAKTIWNISKEIFYEKYISQIYHCSGSGEVVSWYEFALEISRLFNKSNIHFPTIKPILTKDFNQQAIRPKYSALNVEKILRDFNLTEVDWRLSLSNSINGIIGK
ncbi:MAG: dTDP-4-dehydrorhamnose reductase [Alphaproteobacteria bacterium MarineAlpha5_Bin11]|nr:dTDP-4-dehydrorhamnose reductase [Pelagibacteraceae bacterium]PPR44700.1 MAG: dTDP-4-dehydrorhamnose reductase [Alphaproteobacteria bacterium MarineAlpha5_Bin11]|tara:strand:+ start:5483 stop:6358 length:876 start_codon:yes stop_codon:yes gene_type:complete